MWKTKFLVYDENGVYASRAKKFNTSIYGYTLNYHYDRKYFYFTLIGFIENNEKLIKDFFNDLRKDKKVDKLENEGNYFICRIKETKNKESQRQVHLFYNPLLINLKPFYIYPDGWEELEFAAFERKPLEKIFKVAEKKYKLKIKYIKKEKIDSLGVLNILPKLTDKQKNAVEQAIKDGYYEYPRKLGVIDLSKKNKISFSAFQEHLRRAENKLIPFAVKKLW